MQRGARDPNAAGTLPSAPGADFRAEVLCERVLARQSSVGGGDLASARHSELLPEDVAMRLRSARGDAQPFADLFVGAARCDQRDHLQLAFGQADGLITEDWRHAGEPASGLTEQPLSEGRISRGYARSPTRNERAKADSCPRAFASRASSSSNAPIRKSNSNSSRRCVRIISGPSVAIVKTTPFSTNCRNVSRTADSSDNAFVSRFDVGQISSTISRSRKAAISSASPAAQL